MKSTYILLHIVLTSAHKLKNIKITEPVTSPYSTRNSRTREIQFRVVVFEPPQMSRGCLRILACGVPDWFIKHEISLLTVLCTLQCGVCLESRSPMLVIIWSRSGSPPPPRLPAGIKMRSSMRQQHTATSAAMERKSNERRKKARQQH